jgi:hypothetical protein
MERAGRLNLRRSACLVRTVEVVMPGGLAGGGRGQVSRIESLGRPATPEDVWNAAIRAGVDPARMALSLCHVLGERPFAELKVDEEDEPVPVRFTLVTGEEVQYDAEVQNPFSRWEYSSIFK